ncbi:polysaccharide deacetylase family protein [Clostridium septicum]|uniref:Polysaccharide deacetylase n=1 Tax=Clostridium septicum TaxID=1504 RepID=A0A9N7JJR8_CLOSE|nr:polysaccharide deacetylase family protein [Clostridium septicum]AYE33499.1 polysaccharide deacetylase [Clostridium septicum]MDU1315300.1 polysaccharide deacetylase family protein [Clostridium septicum]QAS61668.1 polysaccharide deacetylase [Clostridium septicum]UEC21892.1 polysaccharide deacetylase [Clostridium septicum]USS00077.1 polysaccharide deacetylase [Clostridium septicum]
MKNKLNIFIFSLVFILFISYNICPNALTIHNENDNTESEEKIVYLTFDDGPGGKTTLKILDTLKEENVPATFFIIGEQIQGQENTILRMKNEGHSIGLHSFSHEKAKLYRGNEGFLKEMLEDQESLYKVTGEKYHILRFPFGCNNNTYKLNQSMIDLLHENNLRVYDWNTDSGDGANPNSSPETIIKKACSNKNQNKVILLMHCSYMHKNSAKALPNIIKYYKSEGYKFKAIDENTPELYKIMKK